MITHWQTFIPRCRLLFNPSEWLIRLLGLTRTKGKATEPGLVLIQIDGLAYKHLNRALETGQMPFLRRLLDKENYKEWEHYSGIPSSTPAVQAELFYGVSGAVPAFQFLDIKRNKIQTMYDPMAAADVEKALQKDHVGLLTGGSAYGNIFSGNASESHFCAATLGFHTLLDSIHPIKMMLIILFNTHHILLSMLKATKEFLFAVMDFLKGILKGRNLGKEFKFIFSRVLVSVVLRDVMTAFVKMDISRGLPVIQVNYFGYDEQSHRRGPSSRFASAALPGIDQAVKSLWKQAQIATRRHYDVWIYSDHGQEDVTAYPILYGRTVQDGIKQVFQSCLAHRQMDVRQFHLHAKLFPSQQSHDTFLSSPQGHDKGNGGSQNQLVVTAMGPLGHIYPPCQLNAKERNQIALQLTKEVKIPLVFTQNKKNYWVAYTDEGCFKLPEDAPKILGEDHPFLKEVTHDLLKLCDHPNSGTFLILGWNKKNTLAFPFEGGSHGGPGPIETRGFAMLPVDCEIKNEGRRFVRPAELRVAAFDLLENRCGSSGSLNQNQAANRRSTHAVNGDEEMHKFKVMTYNAHSCVGLDGKLMPERMARIIARHQPDIVALQELDALRARSNHNYQAETIAQLLEMKYHFHPVLNEGGELYGNAVLSRFPMRLIRAGVLPSLRNKSHTEKRGALWLSFQAGNKHIQFINTHLSLWPRERKRQAEALVGRDWLGHPDCKGPVILCGDFNALPGSSSYKLLSAHLNDVQKMDVNHKPRATLPGSRPFMRIDHIFINSKIQVMKVEVPATHIEKMASDHLPLVAEFAT